MNHDPYDTCQEEQEALEILEQMDANYDLSSDESLWSDE